MKILFASVAAMALLVTPALADCAASLTKIEEAMKTATVDDATKANVQTLASEAKTANDNGEFPLKMHLGLKRPATADPHRPTPVRIARENAHAII